MAEGYATVSLTRIEEICVGLTDTMEQLDCNKAEVICACLAMVALQFAKTQMARADMTNFWDMAVSWVGHYFGQDESMTIH